MEDEARPEGSEAPLAADDGSSGVLMADAPVYVEGAEPVTAPDDTAEESEDAGVVQADDTPDEQGAPDTADPAVLSDAAPAETPTSLEDLVQHLGAGANAGDGAAGAAADDAGEEPTAPADDATRGPAEPTAPADGAADAAAEPEETLAEETPAENAPAEEPETEAAAVVPEVAAVPAGVPAGAAPERLAAKLPFWIYMGVWAVFSGGMAYWLWPLSTGPFVDTRPYAYLVLGGLALLIAGIALAVSVFVQVRAAAAEADRVGLGRAIALRFAVSLLVGSLSWAAALVALDLHRLGRLG